MSLVDVNGPVGRVVQKVAGSHAFAPVAKHVVPRLDRVLNRVTGGSFLVVGSNFGQPRHPVWTGNLLKNPDAKVTYAGRTFDVTATLLEGAERAEAWPRLTQVWPVYDRYVEMSGRDLRVFRLTPTGTE